MFRLLFLIILMTSSSAWAHPLAPALLEFKEVQPGQVRARLKRPALGVPGSDVQPQWPEACRVSQDLGIQRKGLGLEQLWEINCPQPLVGKKLGVGGIAGSKADVLLRVTLADGRTLHTVLTPDQTSYRIPPRPQAWQVFSRYLNLGFHHIIGGLDHLLFILGLILLVKNLKSLLGTVTAFTLGHSLTLSLAALGWIRLPSAPVEALIVLSILILAWEVTRSLGGKPSWMGQRPWVLAVGFGLLHGLGFAGALAEAGLPQAEIPLALFAFNLGIELGQCLFIFPIALLKTLMNQWMRFPRKQTAWALSYAMGILAAYWLMERLWELKLFL